MQLEFVPLLAIQREIYRQPRSPERFRAYLATMLDPHAGDLRLPLAAFNPMGKAHVPAALDALLALDAEGVAAGAVADAAADLADAPGQFRVALVLTDDVGGGWTNRFTTEFSHRFEGESLRKRGWLVGMLWTSEAPLTQAVREEVLTSVHRAAHIGRHGPARTLHERLAQEGQAMARAGCAGPTLDGAELAYTRETIAPHLPTRDQPTAIACLFGDAAARALGFPALGLGERAGLALALQDARLNRNASLTSR